MKTKVIKVTQRHIDKGEPTSPFRCPIALALKTARVKHTGVGSHDIWLGDINGPHAIIDLPLEAIRQQRSFDRGRGMTPFEFEIEVPS